MGLFDSTTSTKQTNDGSTKALQDNADLAGRDIKSGNLELKNSGNSSTVTKVTGDFVTNELTDFGALEKAISASAQALDAMEKTSNHALDVVGDAVKKTAVEAIQNAAQAATGSTPATPVETTTDKEKPANFWESPAVIIGGVFLLVGGAFFFFRRKGA